MASIRKAAQQVLDTARDGIGWIAFWREGRGWESEYISADYDERSGRIVIEDEYDMEELRKIYQKDPCAIFVNSYIHNLGTYGDEGDRDTLADSLRWQYSLQHYLVADAIA